MNPNYTRIDERMLQRRVQAMIQRGTVSSVDDAMKMQLLGLDMHAGFAPTNVEHWHPYGTTHVPQAGAEVIALALGGNQDHLVVIATADRRYRLKGLAAGEVAFHDDQEQKVHFQRGGLLVESSKPVTIKSSGTVTIEAPTVVINGNIQHTGNMATSGVHTDSNGVHV